MPAINWASILPVIVSIVIIIAIAILRNYSQAFASIVAVMPINIPLGMWIVAAGAPNPGESLRTFSQSVLINIIPTIVFMVMAYLLLRQGWTLVPTLLGSYAVWGAAMLIVYGIRALIGV